MRKYRNLFIALALAVSLFTSAYAEPGLLSSFSANDIYGNEIDQSVLADAKITLINIWGTFCGPCIEEMPYLGEISRDYADKGVLVIGIVGDTIKNDGTLSEKKIKKAREIAAETEADYTHLLPSEDLNFIMAQIDAYPTTFMVDSEGRQVGKAYVGSMDKDMFEKYIKKGLKEVE